MKRCLLSTPRVCDRDRGVSPLYRMYVSLATYRRRNAMSCKGTHGARDNIYIYIYTRSVSSPDHTPYRAGITSNQLTFHN